MLNSVIGLYEMKFKKAQRFDYLRSIIKLEVIVAETNLRNIYTEI